MRVTVARVKALFGFPKDIQDELINSTQASRGSHKEETSKDIEEAKLDEA
jgi:hypothetical protein